MEKMDIQKAIRREYKKAGQITNLLMDDNVSFDQNKELRKIKNNCFKKIDFYKNLNKVLQTNK